MLGPSPVEVLLIEDLAEHVLLVEEALRVSAGEVRFRVEHANTLEDGLRRLKRGSVDVVMVDLGLPDAQGLEAVRSVRSAAPRVPVVVLTASEEEHVAFEALQAGAQEYLPKSTLAAAGPLLVRTLGMAMERVRLEEDLAEARRISERNLDRLHRERELSAAVLDAEDAVVLVVDPIGRVARHNRKAEEILGPLRHGRTNLHVSDVLEPLHEGGSLDDLLERLPPHGSGGMVETEFRGRDGDDRTLLWQASSIPLPGGTSRYTVLVGTDITEHRRMEARLRERQKLEALGELTGGIAHDFNNLLSIVTINAEMVARELDDSDPDRKEAMQEVLVAAGRARKLVSRLMVFARKGSTQRDPVDLSQMLRELETTLERVFPATMSLHLDLPDEPLPAVLADPVALHQAVVNLANNARDATHGSGTIWISVERVTVGAEEAKVYPWTRPGPFLRIRVRDDGEGMDATTRARSLEPFFTTKPTGKGTGLGLPLVYATARQHEGFVVIESARDMGTSVDVYLPVRRELALRATGGSERREGVAGGYETILLVEDEAALRRTAARVLERFGYHVLTAVDGEEAVHVWRSHRDEISLVISDAVMPNKGGTELFAELRSLGCRTPFILTSGHEEPDALQRRSRLDQIERVLPKPWSVDGLAGAVREILDRAG